MAWQMAVMGTDVAICLSSISFSVWHCLGHFLDGLRYADALHHVHVHEFSIKKGSCTLHVEQHQLLCIHGVWHCSQRPALC
jgi:hypothetical protein